MSWVLLGTLLAAMKLLDSLLHLARSAAVRCSPRTDELLQGSGAVTLAVFFGWRQIFLFRKHSASSPDSWATLAVVLLLALSRYPVTLIKSAADIEKTVIVAKNGTPLHIRDIAVVAQGPKIRVRPVCPRHPSRRRQNH